MVDSGKRRCESCTRGWRAGRAGIDLDADTEELDEGEAVTVLGGGEVGVQGGPVEVLAHEDERVVDGDQVVGADDALRQRRVLSGRRQRVRAARATVRLPTDACEAVRGAGGAVTPTAQPTARLRLRHCRLRLETLEQFELLAEHEEAGAAGVAGVGHLQHHLQPVRHPRRVVHYRVLRLEDLRRVGVLG